MQKSKDTSAKSVEFYLQKENSTLSDLYNKAQIIKGIDQKFKSLIDPSLRDHFELANINTEVAVLIVSNAAWATRFRYNIPKLLDVLNNELNFKAVKTIRIKVKPLTTDKSNTVKKTLSLSKLSAQLLEDNANAIQDPELRDCFLKLSKNYK